jgi:hypothetical protein
MIIHDDLEAGRGLRDGQLELAHRNSLRLLKLDNSNAYGISSTCSAR